MEIRQLLYFTEIVRAGSFTYAARELRIGQPALSKQVQTLERELGVTLLARDAGGVRPTEAGRRLDEMAQSLLAYINEIRDEVRKAASELFGTVTLGISPSLVPALAGHVTAQLASFHPGLKVDIVEALPMFLCEWLSLGRLDVGILSPWHPYELPHRLKFVEIGSDEMLLVGAHGQLADRWQGPVRASDLGRLRLALTKGFSGLLRMRRDLKSVLQSVDLEIDSTHMIRDLVVRGEYCSVLPYSFVRDDLSSSLLDALELEPAFHREVVAATRPGRQTPAGDVVIDVIRARLSELANERPES